MNIMFSTDGNGNWNKRVWKKQCPCKVFMADKCQGVEGHEGDHWCYRPDGSYAWDLQEAKRKEIADKDLDEGVCGQIPPDHKDYISPVVKTKEFYLQFSEDTTITDPEEIARLEAGKIKDGESINRPVSDADYEKFIKNRKKK
jgi:tRNA (cmo5U34)-methyltransferase